MLSIAPVMANAGFRAIDFTSSTHMGITVRNFREDPWRCIRLMRQAIPDTPLQFIGTGFRFISWETAGPDFMRLVYRRLMANGISRFIVLDPMHDMDALLRVARIIREEGDAEIMAALTYTLSEVHDDHFYASILLTPKRARTLIPAIQKAMNGKPLELHSHCTIGLAPQTYMLAADLGIDCLHTGAGPLGNGTSLPSAEHTVANLREAGHKVDIDDEALRKICDYFERVADAEGLPKGAPREYDALRAPRRRGGIAQGRAARIRRSIPAPSGSRRRYDHAQATARRTRSRIQTTCGNR
jgi:oxaloacetate decarboxylase alpha subunit